MNLQRIDEQEIRSIEIRILKEIDAICTAHSVRYSLQYGTLLGAVRHQGFIPWDDDVDICMPREDYERFVSIVKSGLETPTWLEILDSSRDDYYLPFAKVIDNRTIAKMGSSESEYGIWVDVFPVDYVPQNEFLRKCCINICCIMRELTISTITALPSSETRARHWLRRRILNRIGNIIGKRNVCLLTIKTMTLFSARKTDYVACLFPNYRYRELFQYDTLFGQTDLLFEGLSLKGPAEYDVVLKQIYGNYMALPPVEMRQTHGLEAWYKNSTSASTQ